MSSSNGYAASLRQTFEDDGPQAVLDDVQDLRYETPSQFVQGTMFKLDRMKRHQRVLREISSEYPSAAVNELASLAMREMDRNVIATIKAGLRDLGEV